MLTIVPHGLCEEFRFASWPPQLFHLSPASRFRQPTQPVHTVKPSKETSKDFQDNLSGILSVAWLTVKHYRIRAPSQQISLVVIGHTNGNVKFPFVTEMNVF
jgi:hypothetical protein